MLKKPIDALLHDVHDSNDKKSHSAGSLVICNSNVSVNNELIDQI